MKIHCSTYLAANTTNNALKTLKLYPTVPTLIDEWT